VGRGIDSEELRGQLRMELAARLRPSGWELVEARSFNVAELIRPLGGEFAATAEVESGSGAGPLMIDHVFAGVSYEPLRRLAPLLGDRFRFALLGEEIDDRLERKEEDGCLFKVARTEDVAPVADRLAEVIMQRAVPAAQGYASIDALLEEFTDDEEEPYARIEVPALLAAAGRWAEARGALGRCLAVPGEHGLDRDQRRIARQLQRWIDSGGDQSLIPSDPPPSPRDVPPPRSFRETYAETSRRSKARREAVEAVKQRGRGSDREQLRVMLKAELSRRGVSEDPLWSERTLDHLWDSKTEQARLAAEGLKQLGNAGLGVIRALRSHSRPDLSRPDWVEPPQRAAYELRRGDRWIAVELDIAAAEWLDAVYTALPSFFGTAPLVAWVQWDPEPQTVASRLSVHIGHTRVGTISPSHAVAYLPAMKAAAFRDELPRLEARLSLSSGPGRYLLELASPPTSPAD
jgi:hypothetical protein